MNNCLTGGMKKPQRVFGAVWLECVQCGVAQHSVWVIHQTNTAGGHSLAQRYAEQAENNVLRLHPLNLIETHSTGATFTHPPHAHFINLLLACIFSRIIPKTETENRHMGSPSWWEEGLPQRVFQLATCCCVELLCQGQKH